MEVLIFAFSFAITLVLSKIFAERPGRAAFYGIFPREKSGFRRDDREILKVGGIIIFASIALTLSIIGVFKKDFIIGVYDTRKIIGFVAAASVILFLGILDDIKKLGFKTKFMWQIAAAVPLIIGGSKIPLLSFFGRSLEIYWFGYVIMTFWIVLITNAINLIDGLDGLASGVAFITFAALTLIASQFNPAVEILCLACAGSLLAFLRYNFYPAKLFLGDNGSLLLGFMLAVVSIEIDAKVNTLTALSLPILILMLPAGSAVYSFTRRIKSGKNPFIADKLHLHYLLLDAGVPHRVVVVCFWASSMVLSMLGAVSYFLHRRLEFFTLALGTLVLILSYVISMLAISKRNAEK